MKMIQRVVALSCCMYCLTGVVNAFAVGDGLEIIKQQMQQLLEQNQQLSKRVAEMERDVSADKNVDQRFLPDEKTGEGEEQKIHDYVNFFGLIESEFVAGVDFEDNSSNDFNVATVELGLDAQMSEWAIGHILVKYEGPGEDQLFIDEATIQLGDYENFPFLFTAGKFYIPFGKFETHMIQDPLTLEIGESNDYGVTISLLVNGLYSAVFSNNGMKETGDDNVVNGYGIVAGYGLENNNLSLDVGVSWVNNIANSGGISDYLEDAGLNTISSNVEGLGVHLILEFGVVSFIGEYITALDTFAVEEIPFRHQGAEPKAWNVEVAFTTELLGREAIFAAGVQGTRDSLELGLPSTRYIGSASMVLLPGTAITFEYYHDEDYGTYDGGTDENANAFTAQLAYEF